MLRISFKKTSNALVTLVTKSPATAERQRVSYARLSLLAD